MANTVWPPVKPAAAYSHDKATTFFRDFLRQGLGLHVAVDTDPNFIETPERAALAYIELLHGSEKSGRDELISHFNATFPCEYDELVVVTEIAAAGLCPHHCLPVIYTIDVGYLPDGKVLGLSKIPRAVQLMAARPIMQEQLTQELADTFVKRLDAQAVMVRVEGDHTCMRIRGVREANARTITQALRGLALKNNSIKQEFNDLLRK